MSPVSSRCTSCRAIAHRRAAGSLRFDSNTIVVTGSFAMMDSSLWRRDGFSVLRTTPSPPKLSQTQAPILTSAGGQHLQRAQLTISNYLKQVKGTLNDPSIYAYSGLTKMTVRSSGACASELTQVHRP